MSHAPRDLRCSWPDCSYVEDPFDSLEALIKHTKKIHAPSAMPVPLAPKKMAIRCLFTPGCKSLSQTNEDLFRHMERVHWEPIRSRCYLCNLRESSLHSMMNHLEIKHGVSASKHPITFFGKPPLPPPNPWPVFKRPLETWFALVAPVGGDPEAISNLAPSKRAVDPPGSLRAAWNAGVGGTAAKKEETEEELDDRYGFLDEDLRETDTMLSHAESVLAKSKPMLQMIEGNILLATNAKPVPFPIEPLYDEETGEMAVFDEESIGDISGPVHATFYAELRTPPKTRICLSVGYPYKTGQPIVPPPPPPVRGNYLEQRRELLEGKGKDTQTQ